jgi:hypothetical protein
LPYTFTVKRLSLLAFAFLAACAAQTDEDAATGEDAALTQGQLVTSNSPFMWAPGSYDEFRSLVASYSAPLPDAAPAGDPLEQRIQTWLDRIDAAVRADVETRTGKPLVAPKPIAKVLVSRGTFNAWVTPLPACFGAPFGSGQSPGMRPWMDREHVYPYAGACAKPETWSTAAAVDFWNADKPACRLSLADGKLTARGAGCAIDPQAGGGEDLAISSTGQYIQFTTALLQEVEESTLAVVAAHELGHYYLGHTTPTGASKFGYWYTRSEGQTTTPMRDPKSADLEAAYREVVQAGRPLGGPSFDGHYSRRSRPFILQGLAPLLAERKEEGFVCAAARDALGPWTSLIQQTEAPPEDARKAYLDFEAKLVTCAPKLDLGGDPSATAISAGNVLFAAAANKPGPKAKITMKIPDTLGAFLDRLDAESKKLDAKAASLVKRLKDNRIGLYTTEQAADEFAIQIATRMGFTSDEVLAAWLDFMAAIDRVYAAAYDPVTLANWRQTSAELDAPSCKALMDKGFAGVTMNMGALEEPHHAGCYRLYNLWREARAQKFTVGTKPEALTPDWTTLKNEAAQLSAGAPQ